jgi:hypothetical protein
MGDAPTVGSWCTGQRQLLSVLLLTSSLFGGAGCHAPRVASVSHAQVAAAMARRFDGALESAAVEHALDRVVAASLSDPQLADAGEQLLASLAESPELSPLLESIQDGVADTPQMEALVARIVEAYPGAGPVEVGQLIAERSDKVLGSRVVDDALDAAFRRLLERPAVKAAFEELATTTSHNPVITRELWRAFSELSGPKLAARLTELNGGTLPDETRAGELLLEHAFTHERIQTLALSWLGLSATQEAMRKALLGMLHSPAFRQHFHSFLAKVLAAPELQIAVVSAFGVVLEHSAHAERVDAALRQVFDTPLLEREAATFVLAVVRDPELQAAGQSALDGLARSPAFIATFRAFALDW